MIEIKHKMIEKLPHTVTDGTDIFFNLCDRSPIISYGNGWRKSWSDVRAALLYSTDKIICDDAEAFQVLHWCVYNLGGNNVV